MRLGFKKFLRHQPDTPIVVRVATECWQAPVRPQDKPCPAMNERPSRASRPRRHEHKGSCMSESESSNTPRRPEAPIHADILLDWSLAGNRM